MRIAIDARELAGQPTGVGRYLAGILGAWDRLPDAAAHDYVLCAPAPIDGLPAIGGRLSVATAPGGGTRWEQLTLPRLARRAGADVLFAPAYSGPLVARPAPMVLTIHDVSFAAHPEWFAWREGLRRRVLARLAARGAARVLTDSDFSKREIVHHLGVDAGRVEVIYPGFAAVGGTAPDRGAAREPLVLSVGSIFNRRHIPALIDAFGRLAASHPGARLAIVGDNRTTPRLDLEALVAASGAAARIRLYDYLPDADLRQLYATAGAFVFLSEYEGFGMTPLEALSAGVPSVVLDTAVAREVYGPAARYVARPEPAVIADALARLLFDPEARAAVLAPRQAVLGRYSWEACAQRTLQALVACARPAAAGR